MAMICLLGANQMSIQGLLILYVRERGLTIMRTGAKGHFHSYISEGSSKGVRVDSFAYI